MNITPVSVNVAVCLTTRILFSAAQALYLLKYGKNNSLSWFGKSKSMDDASFWNVRAQTYDQQYTNNTPLKLHRLEDAMRTCGNPGVVIELGCGTGRNIEYLHARFPKTTFVGVDGSEQMIMRAKARCGHLDRISFVQIDLRNIGKFDTSLKPEFAFSLSTLTYVDPSVADQVCRYMPVIGCRFFYLEELFVRGYDHGKVLKWPGFPTGIIHNTAYPYILKKFSNTVRLTWRTGIFVNMLVSFDKEMISTENM